MLQHGRLFSIDTGDHAGALRPVDRIDVYSSADTGAWYDELLIHGNNLIVTGYNYEAEASEINVLTIDAGGALTFQVRYFIESDVYWPIQPTLLPTLHVLSVCQIQSDQAFGCKSRGVVGPTYREVYVSPENIYLWLTSDSNDWAHGSEWPDTCPEELDLYRHEPLRSAVFQLPIEGNSVRVARGRRSWPTISTIVLQ